MEDRHDATRCKQCDHLLSFHGEDGCGTWLLGVRAVPLYRCACVVSVSSKPKAFPTVPVHTFDSHRKNNPFEKTEKSEKTEKHDAAKDEFKAKLAQLRPASEAAPPSTRERLLEVSAELRRTAAELKNLEDVLENALRRLHAASQSGGERRQFHERRKNDYAMIADRRSGDRRRARTAA